MDSLSHTQPQDLAGTTSRSSDRGLRRIFTGRNNPIRAGWSALLFLTIYLGLSTGIMAMLGRFVDLESNRPLSPALVFLQESADLLMILIAIWIMARIEHRPIRTYGYGGPRKTIRLFSGVVWGILSLSALVALLWRTHLIVFDGFALSGSAAWKYGLAWASVALLIGIFEESLLRGYLQYTLARGLGFWWAALLLSTAFALWHVSNGGESILGLVIVGLGGLVFCLSLWYTKSLWWAIGFHAGWDWGQSYLYGTPDSGLLAKGHLLASHPSGKPLWSGGPTGPEGSLLIAPLLIAMAAGMWMWWGSRERAPG
jgi:CAAX protease family protein